MRIIVGLGNPGPKYASTRHNVGFMMARFLADQLGIKMYRHQCQALTGEGVALGEKIVLAWPLTYMNGSGKTCRCLQERYSTGPDTFLIIYDDLDLPMGSMRLRLSGGHGGHRGMESIQEEMATRNIPRLRVGIGRPPSGTVTDYVLSPFSAEEKEMLWQCTLTLEKGIKTYIKESPEKAMSILNVKEYKEE